MILRPYSTKPDDQMITDDLWVYQKIGKRGSEPGEFLEHLGGIGSVDARASDERKRW